jgi:hypothetical protein
MGSEEENIQNKISSIKNALNEQQSELDRQDLTPKRKRYLHGFLAGKAQRIGIYSLLLREQEEARKWFKNSAEHHIAAYNTQLERAIESFDQTHWEGMPTVLRDGFYTALLTDDRNIIDYALDAADSMDPEYPNHHRDFLHEYYYIKSLAALIRDENEAERLVTELRTQVHDLRPELQDHFEPLATALSGIVNDDAEQVTDGLDRFLEKHEADIDGEPERAQEHICLPVMALIELAKIQGLDVQLESEYLTSSPTER